MLDSYQWGAVDWSADEIKSKIPAFLELYAKRPVADNEGGMKTPHMFAFYFMLQKLKPKVVIESGIWRGQGTWLIENVLPEATIIGIDIDLTKREFISPKATYYEQDFGTIDWSGIPNKEDALLFFDDHQNALERIRKGKALGFKTFIFEDNYPAKRGDCYSLKKAVAGVGFTPERPRVQSVRALASRLLRRRIPGSVPPNSDDASYLRECLDLYYEFPPVYRTERTRWGDLWNDADYLTSQPLYTDLLDSNNLVFQEDATSYTWICLARLK